MGKIELIDAGCFISQVNELLLIDPLYINYAITHYFNQFINNKKELLADEKLNGIYFHNAKPGLWSSFAIKENNSFFNYRGTAKCKNDYDKNYNNDMIVSFVCFNNTEFMHEYLTAEKINELDWKTYDLNAKRTENYLGDDDNNNNSSIGKRNNAEKENNVERVNDVEQLLPINYFTNILTVESGQVGLFCIESIKRSSNNLLQKNYNNDINSKEQLDNVFQKNLNELYPWYNKICDLTLSSSIGIIDFMNMPIGCVCISNSDCVVNYMCEVVKDEITDEIWAIRVNFFNPMK